MGRRKSRGKRRPAASATTVTAPSLSAIPLLSDDEHNNAAIAYDSESDDDNGLHRRRPEPADPEPVDMFDTIICCICCDNKGEKEEGVLVCSERGCPVTVHANCLGSEPKFDDSGNFCCPYCCYKRAADTCQQLREKAVAAKKALSRFLDNDNDARAGADSSAPAPAAAAARVNPVQDSEELMEETETQAQFEENKDEEGKVRDSEELVEEMETGTEAQSQENEDEGKVQDSEELTEEMETETEEQSEEDKDEGEAHVGADSSAAAAARVNSVQDREELMEEETESQSEEKKDEEGKVTVTSSSVSETNDSESEAISVKKRKDQKKKKVASAKKSLLQQEHSNKHYNTRLTRGKIANEEEVTSCQTLSLRQQPQRMKRSLLTAKRKRLLWTAEEEKVLKEGVSKFSTENQNIPWKKILEFGCRVFEKTRTPVDLKDKWKNIISKEGWKN